MVEHKMMWLFFLMTLIKVNTQNLNMTEAVGNILNNPCTDRNHLVLVPGVLTAGGTNRACISRFDTDGTAKLQLTLVSEDRQTITASRELPAGDGGCLDINVPQLPNTKADFIVNIRYPEAQCYWERHMSLRVAAGRVVTVHTERARYRPGDTLRLRILALKPDLTPSHGLIEEAWLEGPRGAWEGSRVTQWLRLRTRLGLAQLQYQIDELAPPGKWTVRARLADGSQGSAAFWVSNYELPPFQLSVRHAARVLRTSDRLVWTVCVRYPWSEAVEGMLVIRLRGAGGSAGTSSAGIRTAVQLRAPKACHRHAAAARRIGLNGTYPPDVIVADFSFQEEGTRIWQNTTVVSQVVDTPISLEFLTKHRAVVSPGLPYKLKVKATRWDDKPATNERIRVCRHPTTQTEDTPLLVTIATHDPSCTEGVTDATGVARLLFAAADDAAPFYRFEANLWNDTRSAAAPLTLPVRRGARAYAALGPLRADAHGARTLVPLYLHMPNYTTPVTVHFVVITRGGTIYRWGATTQCPITNSEQIRTAPRNSRCSANLIYNENQARRDIMFIHHDSGTAKSDYDTDKSDYNTDKSVYNSDKSDYYIAKSVKNNTDKSVYNTNKSDYNIDKSVYNTDKSDYYAAKSVKNNAKNDNNSDKLHNILLGQRRSDIDPYIRHVRFAKNETLATYDANMTQIDPDALLDRHLLKVMLPIKVSHQMCPDSHLIAYFYHNGEFVSASKHFEMDECFANKVDTTWLSRQVLPGSTASLQISTPGPALCALSALDIAAKWAQPFQTVKELLVGGLRKLMDSHRNLTEYDAAGDCFFNLDTPDTPTNTIELTSSWLAAAGVRLLGGDLPAWRHCEPHPAAALVSGDVTTPRTDFSEAWLWRLVAISTNGTGVVTARAPDSITRFEASAFCVSRNGVSISPPAVLQVFREFFIHADSPKRLKRGDTAIIRYRLFNYLYEPLSVQIEVLTDPHMEGPRSPAETACVGARSSVARRAEVRARVTASATLSIRAKAIASSNCGNNTSRRTGVSDEIVIRIDVEPEGAPVYEQKSVLLCGNGSTESHISEVRWTWTPVVSVLGTESLTVWAAGDDTGPLLADANSLVMIPRGCGEQNMAQVATNLLALSQLEPSSIAALAAREHIARGITRQLQYVHPTGGFSAFGPSDSSSSTWLTAFVLKHMRKAHKILWPNLQIPPAIIRAERWLLSQQMENGCFRNEGQVFHGELKGGLNEEGEIASVALTAYVITSLLDSTSPLPFRVVRNTLSCLRALPPLKSKSSTRVYAHALLAYAYMKLEKYEEVLRKSNEASYLRKNNFRAGLERDEGPRKIQELLKLATRNGEAFGNSVWWETSSLATSIEATGYALLALRESPPSIRDTGEGSEAAAGARRWLASHRGVSGGFVSTQDTLVALEALTAWSSLQSNTPTNLNVTISCSGLEKRLALLPRDKIPSIMKMRPGETLDVSVEGTGCALVQATRSYNTLALDNVHEKQLSAQVSVQTDGPFDCDTNGTTCFCATVIEACVLWNGAFPEMALMEVALPAGFGADAALLYAQLHQPDTLLRRIELTPTNSRATFYLGTRDGSDTNGLNGHQCYKIHAVGPRARTRPAYVRVQDYYKPEMNDTQVYTIPEDCPPRISHDTNQYKASDNLFNKARSSDNGEIVITQEFSFEDIPEGIPLEDPLYDNLTRKEKNKAELNKEKDSNIPTENNRPGPELDTHNKKIVANTIDFNGPENIYTELPIIEHIYTNHKINNSKLQLHNNLVNEMNKFTLNNNDKKYISNYSTYMLEEKDDRTDINLHSITTGTLTSKENGIKASIANEKNTGNTESVVSKPTSTGIDNPNLSNFHVIDSEKDLEVPSGLEGPVPVMVLPPQNFIPPPKINGDLRRLHSFQTPRGPYYYSEAVDNSYNRRYFIPVY